MSKPFRATAMPAAALPGEQHAESLGEVSSVTQDINVLALVKGEERYIFLFDDERRTEALRTLGRFASNPELSFSWYDAAVLSQRIRQTVPDVTIEVERLEQADRFEPRPRFNLPLPTDADEELT
jgi:hypothetical protein